MGHVSKSNWPDFHRREKVDLVDRGFQTVASNCCVEVAHRCKLKSSRAIYACCDRGRLKGGWGGGVGNLQGALVTTPCQALMTTSIQNQIRRGDITISRTDPIHRILALIFFTVFADLGPSPPLDYFRCVRIRRHNSISISFLPTGTIGCWYWNDWILVC